MVKVTYECDTTGQKLTVMYKDGPEPNTMAMSVQFEPELRDGVKDPYGVLGALYQALIEKGG